MIVVAGVAVAVVVAAVVLARRRLVTVTVEGFSMYPALRPGDVLLVAVRARPRPGGVAVVRRGHPVHGWRSPAAPGGSRWLVKRVAAVAGDPVPAWAPVPDAVVPAGALLVLGDNPRSADSKQWGYCPAGAVLGRSLCLLRRGPAARPMVHETDRPSTPPADGSATGAGRMPSHGGRT